MNSLVVGPYVLAGDRMATVAAIFAFAVLSSALGFSSDRAIVRWSGQALFAGLAVARLGFAIEHFNHFYEEPLRIFKVWQGGFDLLAGIAAILVVTAFYVRKPRVLVACVAALAVSSATWFTVRSFTTIAATKALPPQAFEQLQGPSITLAETDGRPAVINIWATWCPPCRHELPMFAEAAQKRKDVVFFFVNAGEAPEAIRAFLTSEHLSLPHVLLDPAKAVPNYYGVPGYPATLFVRPDGTIAVSQIGEVLPDDLDAFIAKAKGG